MTLEPLKPHSWEWYARLARELGGYRHPWARVLDGPDPELTFDALLAERLGPGGRVLEAGCGHGPDAARFGPRVGRWAAFDMVPELAAQARVNAPHADIHEWTAKGEVPPGLRGPFDLIVSNPPYIKSADIATLATDQAHIASGNVAITVSAVNDAPTITNAATVMLTSTNEDTTSGAKIGRAHV